MSTTALHNTSASKNESAGMKHAPLCKKTPKRSTELKMNKINDKIRPEHKKKTNTDNNEFEYSVDMKLLPLEPIRENLVEYKTEPKSKVGDHGGRENSKQHEGKDKAKDRNQDAWQ